MAGFGNILTAALTYIGARNQARQQAAQQQQQRQDVLQQRAIQNRLAEQEATQRAMDAASEQTYRTQTLANDQTRIHDERVRDGQDPNTGALNPLPSLPSSITKGVANSTQGTLRQQMQHQLAIASFYRNDPDPQAQKAASDALAAANALKSIIEEQDRTAQALQRLIIEHNFRVQEKGIPSYGELHPRGRGGGAGDGSLKGPADADALRYADEQLRKSPNVRATAARLHAAAEAAGASERTLKGIEDLGNYYDNKKFPQQPRQQNGSSL